MKTLSEKATIYRQGFAAEGGVTVIRHEETTDQCERIQIGATLHRSDELEITDTTIRSLISDWEIKL
jgi:hypothetical protein